MFFFFVDITGFVSLRLAPVPELSFVIREGRGGGAGRSPSDPVFGVRSRAP